MKKSEFKVGNIFKIKGFRKRFNIATKYEDGSFGITDQSRRYYAEASINLEGKRYILSLETKVTRFKRLGLEIVLIPFEDLEFIK